MARDHMLGWTGHLIFLEHQKDKPRRTTNKPKPTLSWSEEIARRQKDIDPDKPKTSIHIKDCTIDTSYIVNIDGCTISASPHIISSGKTVPDKEYIISILEEYNKSHKKLSALAKREETLNRLRKL